LLEAAVFFVPALNISFQVNHILKMKGMEKDFPFFTTVYKISYEDTPLEAITTTPY